MRRFLLAICLSSVALIGCDDAKKADPKVSDPSKIDPRLKPAGAGGGGEVPKTAPTAPKVNESIKPLP